MTAYQTYLLDLARAGDGAASQELFESLTEKVTDEGTVTGLVDTRTYSAVAAGLSAGEYREMLA